MDKSDEIINRVASSSLMVFELEEFYQPGERVLLDLKDQLYEGLILKEKNFREFIRTHNWQAYQGKFLAITCSADAIVPVWAFMLAALAAQPYAKRVMVGTLQELEHQLFCEAFNKVDWSRYEASRVVVKGCSKYDIPVSVYAEVAVRLRPLVRSLMFGEPCSTVPLYKSAIKNFED
ncbi:MAG: DUF2480 family protein [Cyclobacteriaceae bacterium]|nr:DUF2480 family protein [Cyclobacteriaceae bacterium]